MLGTARPDSLNHPAFLPHAAFHRGDVGVDEVLPLVVERHVPWENGERRGVIHRQIGMYGGFYRVHVWGEASMPGERGREVREFSSSQDRAYETWEGARQARDLETALHTDPVRHKALVAALERHNVPSSIEHFASPFRPEEALGRVRGDLHAQVGGTYEPGASVLQWSAEHGVDPLLAFRMAYLNAAVDPRHPMQLAFRPELMRQEVPSVEEASDALHAAVKGLPASARAQRARCLAMDVVLRADGVDAVVPALSGLEEVGRALHRSGWKDEAQAMWRAGAGLVRASVAPFQREEAKAFRAYLGHASQDGEGGREARLAAFRAQAQQRLDERVARLRKTDTTAQRAQAIEGATVEATPVSTRGGGDVR